MLELKRFGPDPFKPEEASEGESFVRRTHGFAPDHKTLLKKANLVLQEKRRLPSLTFPQIFQKILGDIPFTERSAYMSAIGKMLNGRSILAKQADLQRRRERHKVVT